MDLYATGFNAWAQLDMTASSPSTTSSREEPEDIPTLTRMLQHEGNIEKVYASLSCTLVKTSTGLLSAGYPDAYMASEDLKNATLASTAAIAGNEKIAVFDGDHTIHQYASYHTHQTNTPEHIFPSLHSVVQLLAYETGFVALTSTGHVWTWGDERYLACLGRDVSDSSPADIPALIPDLEDLPTGTITKIACGGYTLMARTEGNDLYVWGGHPGKAAVFEGITEQPCPVLVEDSDIADCAVGEGHAVVLTTNGDVFAVGDNMNGQLGIPGDIRKLQAWTRVPHTQETGGKIIGVACGPRSSFVIAKHHIS